MFAKVSPVYPIGLDMNQQTTLANVELSVGKLDSYVLS